MADIKTLTRKEFGPDIPEHVKNYFAENESRFASPVTVSFDTARIAKTLKVDAADAEALAFLLWRARLVARETTASWPEAVDHAWLRTELFKVCNQRRKDRIAQAEARRERLNALVLTGVDSNTDGEVGA